MKRAPDLAPLPARAPHEIRFFKPLDEPSDTEKALRFLVYAVVALASLLLIVWACLTWGPKP